MTPHTRMIYAVAVMMLTVMLIFLGFAFAQWSGDPSTWDGTDRGFFVFITFLLTPFSGAMTYALLGDIE